MIQQQEQKAEQLRADLAEFGIDADEAWRSWASRLIMREWLKCETLDQREEMLGCIVFLSRMKAKQ